MGKDGDKYKKLVENMLNNIKNGKTVKKPISEGRIKYEDETSERMLPKIEDDLRNRTHSLGDHAIFPEGGDRHFEEEMMSERFADVVRTVKQTFDVDAIDNSRVIANMPNMVLQSMAIEKANKKELEEIAIQMIRDEYNIPEDMVDIEATLTDNVDLGGIEINREPSDIKFEHESHEELTNLNNEVKKRRFINAMNQGAAMKTNHMYHLVSDKLADIDPTLPTKYAKMMAAADYMYYVVDNVDNSPSVMGGLVRIELPRKEGDKPKIIAQALVFPVLIHELVKGVMELLASHALPQTQKERDYVLGKADYMNAEVWDMRLGPGLWGKLTNAIEPADFPLKHHLYTDLCMLPVDEFNETMREIISGSKQGKQIVKDMIDEIKKDLSKDDFERSLDERRMEYDNSNEGGSLPSNGRIEDPDELEDYFNNFK